CGVRVSRMRTSPAMAMTPLGSVRITIGSGVDSPPRPTRAAATPARANCARPRNDDATQVVRAEAADLAIALALQRAMLRGAMAMNSGIMSGHDAIPANAEARVARTPTMLSVRPVPARRISEYRRLSRFEASVVSDMPIALIAKAMP